MGPARNGKSTIVNDILRCQACATSVRADVPMTGGAWITLYQPHSDHPEENNGNSNDYKEEKDNGDGKSEPKAQFYIMDMEGVSHGFTTLTKKLFYACYAISNVIIWNDKNVAEDKTTIPGSSQKYAAVTGFGTFSTILGLSSGDSGRYREALLGVVFGILNAAFVGLVGVGGEKLYCWYKGDNYVAYALGKTDDEIKLDQTKVKNKSEYIFSTVWPWENYINIQQICPGHCFCNHVKIYSEA